MYCYKVFLQQETNTKIANEYKTMLSQGNRTMQHVFAYRNLQLLFASGDRLLPRPVLY